MNSRNHQFSASFINTLWRAMLFIFAAAFLVAGCAGSKSLTVAPVAETGDESICTLSSDGTDFRCTLAKEGARQCSATMTPEMGALFLNRMTTISLEMLYLDGEPGGTAPYRYNNEPAVIEQIHVESCEVSHGQCMCRLSYTDRSLKEILYDSAGCRRNSKFQSHPLYFRGARCY